MSFLGLFLMHSLYETISYVLVTSLYSSGHRKFLEKQREGEKDLGHVIEPLRKDARLPWKNNYNKE